MGLKINYENINNHIEKRIYILEVIFKILFLLYAMLSYNSLTYGKSIISFVMWPMILTGIIILIYRVLNYKKYIKMPLINVLLLFLASFFISMFINYNYGLKQNCITFIFLVFYFLILYMQNMTLEINIIKREFNIISLFFCIYMTICVVLSLNMFVTGYGNVTVLSDGYEVVTGFMWGRLFGTFLEPNPAAVMSVVSILLFVYWIREQKKLSVTIVAGISMFLHLLYISFSDSRTAKVCLIFVSFFYVLMEVYQSKEKYKGFVKKILVCIYLGLTIIVSASVVDVIKDSYNTIAIELSADVEERIDSEENTTETEDANVTTQVKLIDRGYDIKSDPSNRRFSIWKSGIEIFLQNKIWGTSYYGIQPYAYDNLPNTYIINNSQTNFRNLHNEFLNILVSQGLIGLIIVIILIILFIIFLFKNYNRIGGEEIVLVNTLLLSIVAIGISVMFVAAGMFYYNVPSSNLFWMYLGYVVFIIIKSVADKEGNINER